MADYGGFASPLSSKDLRTSALANVGYETRRSLPYDHPLINDYASKVEQVYNLPSGLLNSIKNNGERTQNHQVSSKGAQGIMQLMPATSADLGVSDPLDPMASVHAAGKYLAWISSHLNTQDPAIIAAAYNAGPNRADLKAHQLPNHAGIVGYAKRVLQGMGIDPYTQTSSAFGSAPTPANMDAQIAKKAQAAPQEPQGIGGLTLWDGL